MNKITDFSKQDPEKILAEPLVLGKKQMIVKQEMLGQKQALDPTVLPKAPSEDWQILKRWGFQKLKDIDDLFCECIFPPGWKKSPYYRMWTDILDERGLAKASYFYKAVYYDRRANISINKRFISKDLVGGEDEIDPTVFSKIGIIDISRNNKWLVHVFFSHKYRFAPKQKAISSQTQSTLGVGIHFLLGAYYMGENHLSKLLSSLEPQIKNNLSIAQEMIVENKK